MVKRTGPAAVKIAIAMADEGMIDREEAVMRVTPSQLDQLLHPVFDTASLKNLIKLTTGISAVAGVLLWAGVAFSSEDAVEMVKDGPVLLVRKETTPDDIHGMDGFERRLPDSRRWQVQPRGGGRARHGSRPCVVGAGEIRINEAKKVFTAQVAGKTITVRGRRFHLPRRHRTGDVYLWPGAVRRTGPGAYCTTTSASSMSWTDEFRGKFGVRANAAHSRVTPKSHASSAREGIGLCRTEHMFSRRGPGCRARAGHDPRSRRKDPS